MKTKKILLISLLTIILLTITLLILSACGPVVIPSFAGKPNDVADDSIDSEVLEGDIVQVYGNYIIKSLGDKIIIIHTDNGELLKVAEQKLICSGINDMLIYEHYLIIQSYCITHC